MLTRPDIELKFSRLNEKIDGNLTIEHVSSTDHNFGAPSTHAQYFWLPLLPEERDRRLRLEGDSSHVHKGTRKLKFLLRVNFDQFCPPQQFGHPSPDYK